MDCLAGTKLLPIKISTLGGWHSKTVSLVIEVVLSVANRAKGPFPNVKDTLLQQHSALIIALNAACLLKGLAGKF